MTEISKASRENLLPVAIQELEINVPIFRVDETKTLLKFYVLGHSAPISWRKPRTTKAKAKPKTEEE